MFNNAASLVRWWLTSGRIAMGQVRAIDYGRDGQGGPRDFTVLTRLHAKFADVVRSTKELTDDQESLLVLCYREGKSDSQIAERHGLSRSAITRRRMAALRVVEVHARELGLLPEAPAPYPQSSRERYRRPTEQEVANA